MNNTSSTGKFGEDLAADFLIKRGHEILRRNFIYQRCEIDIIARKDNWLLFVEVKTRSSDDFGNPEEFVSSAQAGRIMHAAEQFIYTTNWHGHIRFDIISVKNGAVPELVHFEDAIS